MAEILAADTGFRIDPAEERDLPSILAIYNLAVAHTTASWDHEPQTLEYRKRWFQEQQGTGYPVIVARSLRHEGEEVILGVAWSSPFRSKVGFRYTAENSVYVASTGQRRGVGKALLQATLDEANRMGLHTVIAGIDGEGEASLRMHLKAGFVETGRMPRIGYKFGRWLDLVYMQIELRGGLQGEIEAKKCQPVDNPSI